MFQKVSPIHRFALTVLVTASVALPSLAQSTTVVTTPVVVSGVDVTTAPAILRSSALGQTLVDSPDRLFVLRAADGNMAEVALGRLALRKSDNPQIRQMAQMIIQDHTLANNELTQIAGRRSYPLPAQVGAMHMATQKQLAALPRHEFDRMYAAAMVESHENTILLFQHELMMGRDADVKAYASRYLPGILAHAEASYALAGRLGAPGSLERSPIALGMQANTTPPRTNGALMITGITRENLVTDPATIRAIMENPANRANIGNAGSGSSSGNINSSHAH